ncbi:hypothetical protein GCM10028820_14080 [Tessaracoccus terricola]
MLDGKVKAVVNKPRPVYLSALGDFGNIGDQVIRRIIIRWMREVGPLRAYVGRGSDAWVAQCGLRATDTLYKAPRLKGWLFEVCLGPRGRILVFDPGEVSLTTRDVLNEIAFLVMTLSTRIAGGAVVRAPRAVRSQQRVNPIALWLHRLSCRLSSIVLWRNQESRDLFRVGVVTPDLGFSEKVDPGMPGRHRTQLVVSLRGDRPFPSEAWQGGVRAYARQSGLEIVTVAQVLDDEARSIEMAERLGGRHVAWDDSSPRAQELSCTEEYGRARMVLSDRLHVLVLGVLAGAVPVELVAAPTGKLSKHFEAIGWRGVSKDASGMSESQICEELSDSARPREGGEGHLASAQEDLETLRRAVIESLGSRQKFVEVFRRFRDGR